MSFLASFKVDSGDLHKITAAAEGVSFFLSSWLVAVKMSVKSLIIFSLVLFYLLIVWVWEWKREV
jgi:hypothetical protein